MAARGTRRLGRGIRHGEALYDAGRSPLPYWGGALCFRGEIKAQVPYYVKRSIAGNGVSQFRLKAGQRFTVHLKGLGWTQLDNTIAVDYDNSYVGYGCGFNSNGDVVMHLVATGAPGTHLIDMYPLLYTQQPSYPNTPYGMVPVLTYARDVPGLALGYQLPAIRLAIEVVK